MLFVYWFRLEINTPRHLFLYTWNQTAILPNQIEVERYTYQRHPGFWLVDGNKCRFCEQQVELWVHNFYFCSVLKELWYEIEILLSCKSLRSACLSPMQSLFGIHEKGTNWCSALSDGVHKILYLDLYRFRRVYQPWAERCRSSRTLNVSSISSPNAKKSV